ncbi:MAG TPA: Rossmann-like and DUF2520 domain-containing protein [Solirubrobacteraceae bacterium]
MELERLTDTTALPDPSVGIVGRGRVGRVFSAGLRAAGIPASDPLGRDARLGAYQAVLLCVPDSQIGELAARIEPGPLVGHCSGATGLEVLAPHEAFALHPLMTVTLRDGPARLRGAAAAIAGTTPRARGLAAALAEKLGMRPFSLADEDRAAYHAAAAMASNFLVTLEAAAEAVGAGTGLDRELLAPLVRATVENWAELGPHEALTGPVARGDEATVQTQRAAVAEQTPDLVELFDTLVGATRRLAADHELGAPRTGSTRPPRAAVGA